MREPVRVVAVIAANPALSSILGMMLAASPGLRVRQFETHKALETYMRLAPVDLIVADFDCEAAPADQLAERLRDNLALGHQHFEIVALTHSATASVKNAAVRAGISEVIVKPMSPRYLLDRVMARLKGDRRSVPAPRIPRGPHRDNVVPLFPA